MSAVGSGPDRWKECGAPAVILLGPGAEAADLDALGGRTAVVAVGRRAPGARVDSVRTAESKGSRQAMDLVELGHRRIVRIDGGGGPGSAERRRAYRPAMRRHGLEDELRVLPGDHTEQSGIATVLLFLTARERGRPLPTAVLAGDDRCARGLLMALTREGVEPPRDLSVVGYDDSHLSHPMPVGLTTVRQDALGDPDAVPRAAVLEPNERAAAGGDGLSAAVRAGRQPVAAFRVVNPMAAATAARTATLVRAVGREDHSAMKPIAGGPRSMPP